MSAEYGPPPAPPAGGQPQGRGGRGGGRGPMLPGTYTILMVGK